MIKYTLLLYVVFTINNIFACARTESDTYAFGLMQKNIKLQNIALLKLQEQIIMKETHKLYLMHMVQNRRIPQNAYFMHMYQINNKIKLYKSSQDCLALQRDNDIAWNITKKCIKTAQPVFSQSEISNLQNTHQAILRGMSLLQRIAHDEQQTLAQLQQVAMSSRL